MKLCRVFVFMTLALLMVPRVALAEDVSYIGSFASGFETLLGRGENEQVTPERDYIESYEPREVDDLPPLRAPSANTELDSMGGIQQVVDRTNRIEWGTAGNPSLVRTLAYFLGNTGAGHSGEMRNMLILPAIGLCFMWWGVRKGLRMIFAAFRKGKATT